MNNASSKSWLRPFLEPLKPTFREVLVLSCFVNILALAAPVFVLQVYDRVVFQAGINTLYGLVIGMVLVIVFDYILRQTRARMMQTVALRIDVQVGERLFEKLMALPLQLLENKPAAHWQALFRDVDSVRNTLSGASAILLADLPFAIFFLALMYVIAAPLAIVLSIVLPIFLFVAWRSGNVMSGANQEERKTTQNRDSLMAELVNGRTTIKALGLDRAMRPMWEESHADNIEKSKYRGSRTDGFTNIGSSLTVITSVMLTSVGAFLIIQQELTMGALIATNMLSGRLLGPLNQLVNQWRTYSSFRDSVDRLGETFTAPSERMESEVSLGRPKGEIVFEAVSFSYAPDLPSIIDGIDITFQAGQTHALIGRNGSGKTTVLKLLQGLYQPTDGRVLLDDADLNQFSRPELSKWIGYVPQECVLFEGTVRENVAHRKPDATDEEVISAATAAGVHHFIIDMPDGYATNIGEAGSRLSGGQRQRIAIARALIGDPPIVLLDEPSSSLDRQAEQELRDTITQIGTERTVIIVTHSPMLLATCDNLIALDKGKVALAGPAKEILPKLFGSSGKKQETNQTAASKSVAKQTPVAKPAANPAPAAKPATGTSSTAPVAAVKSTGGSATTAPPGKPIGRIIPKKVPASEAKPGSMTPTALRGSDDAKEEPS